MTVDEYIGAQTPQAQTRLKELRSAIRSAVPEVEETISYGMPTYIFEGRRVHFAAASRHCALYGAANDRFVEQLRGYKTLKGTVQFALDQPIPAELVRKMVVAKLRGTTEVTR